MRVKITLACQDCKQRNYNMTKDKKTHPDRMETKKYCKFCKKHTDAQGNKVIGGVVYVKKRRDFFTFLEEKLVSGAESRVRQDHLA